MADGLPVERLRQYLREFKPEARVLLTGELERGLLRGERTPGAELVLQECAVPCANPYARRSASAVLPVCFSSLSSLSSSMISLPTVIRAVLPASPSSQFGSGSAVICSRVKRRLSLTTLAAPLPITILLG